MFLTIKKGITIIPILEYVYLHDYIPLAILAFIIVLTVFISAIVGYYIFEQD